MESRMLLAVDLISTNVAPLADMATAVPIAISRPVAAPAAVDSSASSAAPSAAAASAPYSPAQVRHAYGFDQLSLDGTGQTIAIVDAYDNPNIAADLQAFDARFGLPDPTLIKATPQGTPARNSGWETEIALDVEWAHAIAPKATILLVEAKSASVNDLLAAVDYAVRNGANQVSMSWGAREFSGVSSLDSYFNHPGVTFLASAGDSGTEVEFPAVSPYVTGVGGTSLSIDASSNRLSETVWSGSGGGISAQVARPAFQAGFVSGANRGAPDVSYDADPYTGVYVLDNGSWFGVGGTSAGAPQWAGLIALANQGRAAAGLPSLGTGQALGTNSVLYGLAGGSSYTNANGDFLDITSGSNGTPAAVGYDTATGLGSPVADKLVPDLIGPPAPTAPAVPDAGFEAVAVGPGNFAYAPAGSPWAFAGGAGISGNSSGFTSGNPAAPQGQQVAFLQGTGSLSQSVAGWAAGSYTVSFQAAQRGNFGTSVEDFRVLVDGVVVGTFRPAGTAYQPYATASFAVTAGAHTLAFQGVDTAGGDNTALIDAIAVNTA